MGENREIIEVYRRPLPRSWGGEPNEIVEVYRRTFPAEVVERYSRPLPWSHPAAKCPSLEMREISIPLRRIREEDGEGRVVSPEKDTKRGRHKKTGLAAFVLCVGILVGVTAAVHIWENQNQRNRWDPFEHYSWDQMPEEFTSGEISIPTWPVGQGVTLTVVRDHGETLTAQAVYQQVNPSVVTVLAGVGNDRMSVGTGVIFTEDGYLVTNYHVVEGGQDCSVVLNTGYRCDARYVAGDQNQDIAVLKILPEALEGIAPLSAAQFGDSDLLTVGDPVYAIGNPLGWELRGTLTDGIVSAINRDVEVDGRTMTLIQTNAALNSGNSGGPLINQYGQVVGINVIKMSSSYSTVEGLGFAIPSALMERMVNDLLTWGELQPEPTLGVTVLLVAEPLEEGVQGLRVQSVESGSPAAQAGVQEGDCILFANGEPLFASQDLLRIRRRCYLGDELTLTLWRDGETLDVVLELDQKAG